MVACDCVTLLARYTIMCTLYTYVSPSTALFQFACRSLITSASLPIVQSQASLLAFRKTSTVLDTKKPRHKIVHEFEVWGAKDKGESRDEELEHREDHHDQSSVSIGHESLHSHLHEVVDMEQSEEHRVAELVEVLLKRRVRMEQELAQGMHLLQTMRLNPPGSGDWMHADSESNLVPQENVGYQYPTVVHHNRSEGKKVYQSSAVGNTCHRRNPAVSNLHLTNAGSRMTEDMSIMSPADSDSPLLSPMAGSCKRQENSRSTQEKADPTPQQFLFSLPGEAVASQDMMNSASTIASPLQWSVNSSATGAKEAH